MPRRRRTEKARRDRLDFWQRFELLTGRPTSGPDGRSFVDDDDRRQAWEDHRDAVTKLYAGRAGRRPWAYFAYDLELPDPDRHHNADPRTGERTIDHHALYLAEHDLLADWERVEILRLVETALAPSLGPAAEVIRARRTRKRTHA